jgi:hypothetical protein
MFGDFRQEHSANELRRWLSSELKQWANTDCSCVVNLYVPS